MSEAWFNEQQFEDSLRNALGYSLQEPDIVALGYLDENGNQIIYVEADDGEPNKYYFHELPGTQPRIGEAYAMGNVIPTEYLRYGTPIRIKPDPLSYGSTPRWLVDGLDPMLSGQFIQSNAKANSKNYIQLDQLIPGAITPTQPESMVVRFRGAPFTYNNQFYYWKSQDSDEFGVDAEDTSSTLITLPTNSMADKFVLVQLNLLTGALSYKVGTPVQSSLTNWQAFQYDYNTVQTAFPQTDNDNFRCGYVRLKADQTKIKASDIWNTQEIYWLLGTIGLAKGGTNADLSATGPGHVIQAANGSALSILKHNLIATANPTVNDDASEGYAAGSMWVNTTNDTVWFLGDNAEGAAVWSNASGGGSMSSFSITGDSGTPESVSDGQTITIAGGTGLTSVVSATDTVTINLDVPVSVTHGGSGADMSATGGGFLRQATTGSAYSVVKYNISATGDPTVNDDTGDGYSIGSMWINVTGDTVWFATDVTLGAAVWKPTSEAFSGTVFTAAADSGSSQAITTGNTLTIAGGTGLSSVASATDTITINLDVPVSVTHGGSGANLSATGAGFLRQATAGANFTVLKTNLTATVDPTVNDDSSGGYAEGSMWVNVTDDKVFIAADVQVGTAIWREVATGAGSMASFNLAADSGTPETVTDGETITIIGGTNIATAITATNDITVNFDGTLPVASGGTGQITATAAFNALDPLTTKGDIIVRDTTNSVRLPVGTNGQILRADSTVANGIKWDDEGELTLAGDSGTPQALAFGNTLTIAGGTGLSSVAGATDTLTVNLDIPVILEHGGTESDLSATGPGHIIQASAGAALTILKHNLAGTASPATTDDSGDGYATGSMWIDATLDTVWFCADAALGAAVWLQVTGTGGTMSSFLAAADSGSAQTIGNGNVLSILGGTNISTTASATDTITIDFEGTLPIASGGTGQTSQTAAFDALSPTTTKGDIIVSNGSDNIRLAVGSNNLPLIANSATASGLAWSALPVAGGGTGQTTATAAFNALDPLTTKGDVIVHDGTNSIRLAVGTNGFGIVADSAQTAGIKWASVVQSLIVAADTGSSQTLTDGNTLTITGGNGIGTTASATDTITIALEAPVLLENGGTEADLSATGPGFLRQASSGAAVTILKHNLTATTNPSVGDDSGDGYDVGSMWVNVTLDTVYFCTDASLGAANWATATASVGGVDSFNVEADDAIPQTVTDSDTVYILGGEGIETSSGFTIDLAIDSLSPAIPSGVDLFAFYDLDGGHWNINFEELTYFQIFGDTGSAVIKNDGAFDIVGGTGIDTSLSGTILTIDLESPVVLENGGTESDLSATGPGHIIQASSGAALSVLKHNLSAAVDPTTGDDSVDGYAVGSLWVNTTDDNVFLCADAAAGNAVWKEVGLNDPVGDIVVTYATREQKTLLYETTLGAAGKFDFSSIPQTYDYLEVELYVASNVAATNDVLYMFFNNDTAPTSYHNQSNRGNNGAAAVAEAANPTIATIPGSSGSPSSEMASIFVRIPNYTTSFRKHALARSMSEYAADTIIGGDILVTWNSTAAINRIEVQADGDPTQQLIAGSMIKVWGFVEEQYVKDVVGGSGPFTVAADSGTPDVISEGDTLTVVGGTGLTTSVSAGTITIDMDSPVSIANGGTGQSSQTAAFDALAPTTTKGDIIVSNGTDNIRLPVGTDSWVLTADSGEASGVKWAASGSGGGSMNSFTITGDVGSQTVIEADTIDFVGGNGLITAVTATDTVTISVTMIDLDYGGTGANLSAAADGAVVKSGSAMTTIKHNLSATTAPVATDDSGDGYAIGSLWINTSTDLIYMATDVTIGTAVWAELTGTGGSGSGIETIMEEGVAVNQRDTVNFIGDYVTAEDDSGNSRTNVTFIEPIGSRLYLARNFR